MLEIFPLFAFLGISALSGSRLAPGRWEARLRLLAMILFLMSLVLFVGLSSLRDELWRGLGAIVGFGGHVLGELQQGS
ncbi:MAG: hypothetical protein CMK07_10360 [Ponticaulis sp.]|nr:hypothetical protein [Ponticaulis sp.]